MMNNDLFADLDEAKDLDPSDSFIDTLDNTVLRLSDYLKTTEAVIKEVFSHHVWVKAEIRNLSSKGGHYYFELAEKDSEGAVIASCRGTLWRNKANGILAKFERATGMALSRDLNVLLKVNSSFHPQYGFALNIHDIDPSHTLGDLAQQYNAMLKQLADEGLLELNQQHATPFDIEHVVVIAPEKAAGLGDFRADADRLAKHGACHFYYHHATFQGNHAPNEIRHAITGSIQQFEQQYQRLPDLMVIIRGGGAVGDLAYLNNYELAALVAEQPIPVWVGIGHERDHVILDDVAHTSFDTPSKVIAAIINHLRLLMQRSQESANKIWQYSQNQLQQAKQISQQQMLSIKTHSQHALNLQQQNTRHTITQITQQARFEVQQASQNSHKLINQLQQHAKGQLNQATQHIKHYQQLILLQHPTKRLKQGYAIIQRPDKLANKQPHIITHTKQLQINQNIQIDMQDGTVYATVSHIEFKNNDGLDEKR